MVRKKHADWDPSCQAAYEQINEIIASLGFTPEKLKAIKNKLERYMPPEVLFDLMGGPKAATEESKKAEERVGQNLIFALFAPEALKAYCGTRDTSVSRRLLFEKDQEPIDFVMSVLTGYRKSGVVENGILDLINRDSRSRYRPGGTGEKDTRCPHCQVSFWANSAGNGDPKYQHLPEWRKTPEEAPEHVVVDKTTGASAPEQSGYHFCGGKHKIELLNPEGMVDIERAEKLGGKSYEQLQAEGRIRGIERNGETQYFLVDERLPKVEELLATKESLKQVAPSLKRFDKNWVIEPQPGEFYRQCRHPIELLSPAQVAKKRIQFYHPYTSIEEGVRYIDIYKCPFCHASYRDREGITDKRKGEQRITALKCQNCGEEFDITDPNVKHVKGKDIRYDESLDASLVGGTEEGDEGEFTHQRVVKVEDNQLAKLEMEEFIKVLETEVRRIAQKLNIRGAEDAWDIIHAAIEGRGLKEIAEQYYGAYYRLHYSQCLDCGFTMDEKSNPAGSAAAMYDEGLPINMQRCPRRHESDKHKPAEVKSVSEIKTETKIETKTEDEGVLGDALDVSEHEQEVKKLQEQPKLSEEETSKNIPDPYERQKYLGLNIMYVGRPTQPNELAECRQMIGWNYNLVPTDTRVMSSTAYTGDARVTRHIYAPAERLIDRIRESLKESVALKEYKYYNWILKQLKKVTFGEASEEVEEAEGTEEAAAVEEVETEEGIEEVEVEEGIEGVKGIEGEIKEGKKRVKKFCK